MTAGILTRWLGGSLVARYFSHCFCRLLLDLSIGAQPLTPRGFELEHDALVSLHCAELGTTHRKCADRCSGPYCCGCRIELHHADLTKKVMRTKSAPVLVAHGYVDQALQDKEEDIVPCSFADQHGTGWNVDLVHLASQ